MEKSKFRMPTAYTILFLLIILVAVSTWLIPAGAYDYVDGVPVAGTYHAVEPSPQGVGGVLKAARSTSPTPWGLGSTSWYVPATGTPST